LCESDSSVINTPKKTMKALITRKIGMTTTISEDGVVQAVTLLAVGDNVVTHMKTIEKDGYMAVQVGHEKVKKEKIGKSLAGHLKASKTTPKMLHEFRVDEFPEEMQLGTEFTAETFAVGDTVKATGTSKGKGWAGTIKRHNFHRGRKTHGGGSYRRPGSIGSMYPQHVLKGKKMAGQMGHEQVTVSNLKIALVNAEDKVIGVSGAVPGPRKGIVIIRGT
jgi:large subunit ribosomal protein L3